MRQHRSLLPILCAALVAAFVAALFAPSAPLGASAPNKKSACAAADTSVKIKEFRVPGSPTGIALGPDDNLWFTLREPDGIARITTAGKITSFPGVTPPPPTQRGPRTSTPLGITLGPDGNLWFTEFGADRIGRVTPDGVITEFGGLTPGGGPQGITTGPDGNLWFTETIARQIGRITPDGVVTEFGGLAPDSLPTGITAGPDGNLWFTADPDIIGRITPAGVVTEFRVPLVPQTYQREGRTFERYAGLGAIIVGPDRNLWFPQRNGGPLTEGEFTSGGAGSIGRVTPSGEFTDFYEGINAVPYETYLGTMQDGSSGVNGITLGPDGNLWFLQAGGVGRITRDGTITEFPGGISPDSEPVLLATGPKKSNTMWFTEADANSVGRITVQCKRPR